MGRTSKGRIAMVKAPVEGYAGRLSYAPGDTLTLHTSSAVESYTVEISRVGADRGVVWRREGVRGVEHETPANASTHGCGWPAALEIELPADWRSGYYEVDLIPEQGKPASVRMPACFVLRSGARRAPLLLVLSTNTYNAYNDWGGGCLYNGETQVSFSRPFAPGLLFKPDAAADLRAATAAGRYDPDLDYQRGLVFGNGLSASSMAAGWWNWERRFVEWAEREGVELDYAVSADLEHHPDVLDGRRLVLSVGHDEYWSWGMRDSLEAFIAGGGNVAFFSGNTAFWQVRFEDDSQTMVCYKYDAATQDPIVKSADVRRVTSLWSDPLIARPENELTGVSMVHGGYVRTGYGIPRGSGGYTVWRPESWLLGDTDLRYGDLFGAEHVIAGYEADGCELTADASGRPIPTHRDGTPEGFEIVATSPARLWANGGDNGCEFPGGGMDFVAEDELGDLEFTATRVYGSTSPEAIARVAHGNAVLGTYTAGGTVVTSGCTDWVYGLDDPLVARITKNVIERLG